MGDFFGFILVTGGFGLGAAVLSFLLHLIRIKWIKYIPNAILGIIAIACLLQSKWELFGDNGSMGDLAALVSAIVFGIMAVAGLITCLLLDKFYSR